MAVKKPGKRTMVTTRTPAGFTSSKNKLSKAGNKTTPAKPESSGMSKAAPKKAVGSKPMPKSRTSAQQKTKTLPYSGGKPKAKKMPGAGGAPKVRQLGR